MAHRPERLAELIRVEISQIIRDELKDPRLKQMVSITTVRVPSDLRSAKVFISVLGPDQEKENVIKGLVAASGFIKRELGKRIRLRHTPDLQFEIDDSIEYGFKISKIIKEINEGTSNDT